MSNHPYPEHVRQAVATTIARQVLVMRKWDDLTKQTREAFLKDADQVLDTLWDASRVGTLGQVDQLPDDAILWGADDMEHDKFTLHVKDVNEELHQALPAHVIFWGDSDA